MDEIGERDQGVQTTSYKKISHRDIMYNTQNIFYYNVITVNNIIIALYGM